jgi:hypothetical protein
MPVGLSPNGSPPIEFKLLEYPPEPPLVNNFVAGKRCQPRRPISLTTRSLLPPRPQQTNTGRIELNDASD